MTGGPGTNQKGDVMTEHHTFGDTELGLTACLYTVLTLRRAGFRVHVVTVTYHGFTLHTVHATPTGRPTRRERGLV